MKCGENREEGFMLHRKGEPQCQVQMTGTEGDLTCLVKEQQVIGDLYDQLRCVFPAPPPRVPMKWHCPGPMVLKAGSPGHSSGLTLKLVQSHSNS